MRMLRTVQELYMRWRGAMERWNLEWPSAQRHQYAMAQCHGEAEPGVVQKPWTTEFSEACAVMLSSPSSGAQLVTLAGLEPAIFGSEDQRLIH